MEIDPAFPAVPLGRATPFETAADLVQPQASETFVVRGFVTSTDPARVPQEMDGAPIFADVPIEPFVTCPGDPAVGGAANVATKLDVAQLTSKGLDGTGVAVAVADTGINVAHLAGKLGSMPRFDAANSWNPAGVTTTPGNHPVGHGTMCAFDVLIAAPKATLLDYSVLRGTAPAGSSAASTVGTAIQAYAHLLVLWAVTFGPGTAGNKYRALVVNNSWGVYHPSWDFPPGHRGRYIDNPNHPLNLQVAALARSGVDIVFAAGNCGADCPSSRCQGNTTQTIMGANAHADVLTVAGCDTNDLRVGYSSQGPSIAGMPQQKPDVTAYTHFLGSEASGAGVPDTGTSAACPIAAGCVAALRTVESPFNTPPANLFAQLRATARQITGSGWNGDFGHGIINPVAAGQSLGIA